MRRGLGLSALLALAAPACPASAATIGAGSFAPASLPTQRHGKSEVPDRALGFKMPGKIDARRWSESLGPLQWGAALIGPTEVGKTVADIMGDLGAILDDPTSPVSPNLLSAINDPNKSSFVATGLRALALVMPGEISHSERQKLLVTAASITGRKMSESEKSSFVNQVSSSLSALHKILGKKPGGGYEKLLRDLAQKNYNDLMGAPGARKESFSTNTRLELASRIGSDVAFNVGTDVVESLFLQVAERTGMKKAGMSSEAIHQTIGDFFTGNSVKLKIQSPLTIPFFEGARPPYVGTVQECVDRALSEEAMVTCVTQAQAHLEGQIGEWVVKNIKVGNRIVDDHGKTLLELPVDVSAHLHRAADEVYARAKQQGKIRDGIPPRDSVQVELLGETFDLTANSMAEEVLSKIYGRVPPEVAKSLKNADSTVRRELIADVVAGFKKEAASVDKLHELAKLGSAKSGGGTRAEEIVLKAWGDSLRKHPDFGAFPPYLVDDSSAYERWKKNPADTSLTDDQRSLFASYLSSMTTASKILAPKPGESSLQGYANRLNGQTGAAAVATASTVLRDQIWKFLDCSAYQQGNAAAVRARLEDDHRKRKEDRDFCHKQQAIARDTYIGPMMHILSPGKTATDPPPNSKRDRTPFQPAVENALELLNFACKTGRKECIDLVDQSLRVLPQTIQDSFAEIKIQDAPLNAIATLLKQEQDRKYAFTACMAEGIIKQAGDDMASDLELNGRDARGIFRSVTESTINPANIRRVLNDPSIRKRLDNFVNSVAKKTSTTSLYGLRTYFSNELMPSLVPTLTDLTARAFTTPYSSAKEVEALNTISTPISVLKAALLIKTPPTELSYKCIERAAQIAVAPWALLATDQASLYLNKALRQGPYFDAPKGINARLNPACWTDPRKPEQLRADLEKISNSFGDGIIGDRSAPSGDGLMKQALEHALLLTPEPGAPPLSPAQDSAWVKAGLWSTQTYEGILERTSPSRFQSKEAPGPLPKVPDPIADAARDAKAQAQSINACQATGFVALASRQDSKPEATPAPKPLTDAELHRPVPSALPAPSR